MDVELLGFILQKVRKIEAYEQYPRTDEQYLNCRNKIFGQLKKARQNLKLTHDIKYKKEIAKLKIKLSYLVSKTEYELCKKIVSDYKSSYSDIIDEEYWNCEDLEFIYLKIIDNRLSTVEQAVELLEDYEENY